MMLDTRQFIINNIQAYYGDGPEPALADIILSIEKGIRGLQ
ncbi:hypothetical protein LCGC14_1442990 [marine sediment metagenome]|uniref:Uncharacterized protein n=1 Tax=marine sediment metagenome TaxID=412755 RepID=A0A0F9M0J0_9ZZZZ